MERRPTALTDERVIVVGRDRCGDSRTGRRSRLRSPTFRRRQPVGLDDLLNIQYTSGTTGFPKGVLQAQRYWMTQSKINAFRDGLAYERILISTPFYYMDPAVAAADGVPPASHRLHRRPAEHQPLYRLAANLADPVLADAGGIDVQESARVRRRVNDIRRVNVYGLRKEIHRAVEERFNVNAREAFGMTELGSATFMPLEVEDMIGSGSCGIAGPFRECQRRRCRKAPKCRVARWANWWSAAAASCAAISTSRRRRERPSSATGSVPGTCSARTSAATSSSSAG